LQHIGQRLIKVCPRKLPGPIPSFRKLLAKIKPTNLASTKEPGTESFLKPLSFHSFHKTRLVEAIHTPGYQAFPDHKPGKMLALHHLYLDSFLVQQRGRHRSGGPCSDY